MPHAFLCDFDGTIAPEDIGEAIMTRFSRGREAEHARLLERWFQEAIPSREMIEEECRLLSVEPSEALAYSRGFGLDPAFAAFARERRDRGDVVMVVSEGFDLYVRDQLERAGLGDLPWTANRLRFEGGRVMPEFPFAHPSCSRCGNCKAQHVRDWQARGHRVVLVGDGLSDRCGALAADRVLARGGLLAWCERQGVPARSFRDFSEVQEIARDGWVG